MRMWLSMAFEFVHAEPVTKHGDQCPSPTGACLVSDGAGIDFVEYMHYKSVRFYNSLE